PSSPCRALLPVTIRGEVPGRAMRGSADLGHFLSFGQRPQRRRGKRAVSIIQLLLDYRAPRVFPRRPPRPGVPAMHLTAGR
ncbi:hypothetical protein EOA33_26805, partial [Mesorhizobium sp. M4A.F.Ca.ET.050.02.1.1]